MLALLCLPYLGHAQAIDVTDETSGEPVKSRPSSKEVGRKAAEKYMAPKQTQSNASGGSRDHYLAVHLGFYPSDNSYQWGNLPSKDGVGKWNAGVTYRIGEWSGSMDLGIRIDISGYNPAGGNATKIAFLPVVTFPEANARFPLYFGAGAGIGVFSSQAPNESALSLDYQLLLGARFFEIMGQTGFFVEGGLKNHFLLLSDGQFNGAFLSAGVVFTF